MTFFFCSGPILIKWFKYVLCKIHQLPGTDITNHVWNYADPWWIQLPLVYLLHLNTAEVKFRSNGSGSDKLIMAHTQLCTAIILYTSHIVVYPPHSATIVAFNVKIGPKHPVSNSSLNISTLILPAIFTVKRCVNKTVFIGIWYFDGNCIFHLRVNLM